MVIVCVGSLRSGETRGAVAASSFSGVGCYRVGWIKCAFIGDMLNLFEM